MRRAYDAVSNGRVVLVTGAAKRIGRGIALRLAREGARVAIHYSSSEAEARATAAECGNAPLFRADLEKVAEIERLFSEVQQHFGKLDGLVNNAARYTRIDPLEITESDWDFVHSVNLKATFFCCQQAARQMLAGEGGRDRQHQLAGRAAGVARSRALLRIESRRDSPDARVGPSLGAEDHGEFGGAGSDPVRGTRRARETADRENTRRTRGDSG